MTEGFNDGMPLRKDEPAKDGSRLAGRAAIDLYFGMIRRNNDALKSQVAKLAIVLDLYKATLAEAERPERKIPVSERLPCAPAAASAVYEASTRRENSDRPAVKHDAISPQGWSNLRPICWRGPAR